MRVARARGWLGSLLAAVLVAGGLMLAGSSPALAQTVSRTFTSVQCTATVNGSQISQTQDITIAITAPDRVDPGSTFTVTFPGASTQLPTRSNGLNITSYSNIFQVLQINSANFDSGSIVNPGTASVLPAGSSTPVSLTEQASLPASNQIRFGQPGPFNPGTPGDANFATLTTPDISVSATAPASGNVTLNMVSLTTTVVLNNTLTANVVCNVPNDPLITIPVGAANTPPTVDAGPDVSGDMQAPIAVTGSVTDPDSTPALAWTINSGSCTFADPAAASTTVTCTTPGTFTATLTADDGVNPPVADTTQVTVNQTTPLAVSAGGPVTGAVSHEIALQGTVVDPSATPTVQWSIDSADCSFADATVPSTTVTCSAIGNYTATLTANDGANPQASDSAPVTVTADVAPTVNAGDDASGNTGAAIALHGSVADPDDTPSVAWTSSSPACSFASPAQADTTISCSAPGTYTATLTADDGFNPPVTDSATITVTDILFPFNWDVDATTHLKKLNMDVTVPTGNFSGVVDLTTGELSGDITLPPAQVTLSLAGFGLVTANMQITETQPITGHLDPATFAVSATAVFDIHVLSAYPTATPSVNLVGDSCKTSTPVSVTMDGTANLSGSSTFSGLYTIPPLENCGLATTALNLVIPGPGNTFSATVAPPPVAPSVTTQPTDVTVSPGESYSFTAAATATPDPSVQWQVSTDGGSTFTDISGAVDPTYGATAATADSGKQFRAVFTNPAGSDTTNAATLTVAVAPDAPVIGTASAGPGRATVDFTPPANDGGSPIIDYTAQCASSDGGAAGSATGAGSPITVNDLTPSATYTCSVTARNAIGSSAPSSASNPVVTTAAPKITTQPSDTSVGAGEPYSFSAAASGTPAPTVQWQVSTDGGSTFTDINGATADDLAGTATLHDSGNEYRAVYTNDAGTATTNAAQLTVTNSTTISVGATSVVEGDSGKNRTATLTVTLSQPSAQNVTVHYATVNGTATAPSDFVAKSGNLTFKAGKTTQYVTVAVKPDVTVEPDETFSVALSNPTGGYSLAAAHAQGGVTILNDDANTSLTVSVGDATVCRSASGPADTAKVLVSLSSPATSTVTVRLALSAGSATSGTDFKPWKPKTLTFKAGQFQKVIAVSVVPGSSSQAKTALLTLSNPSAGLTIGRAAGTVTIIDHD